MSMVTLRAPVNMSVPSLERELINAASDGTVEEVRAALDAGADIEARTAEGDTPLLFAALRNPCREVSQLLVERGANMVAVNNNNESVLIGFAGYGWADLVEKAVAAGCDVNAQDFEKISPLAASGEHLDVVRTLLRKGASPFRVTSLGHLCSDLDSETLLDAALEEGIPIDLRGPDNGTLFMHSFGNDDPALARAYLDRGASLEATNADGQRPIGRAAERGASKCVALLLALGADTSYRTQDGRSFEDQIATCDERVRAVYAAWKSRQTVQQAIRRRSQSVL